MEINIDNYNLRFGGIARLYGVSGLSKLLNSNVLIIGLGGIGSWAAEALARSGVGTITLVDLDEVCITNTNRQLCATATTVGHSKAQVLKQRIHSINPDANVFLFEDFFTEKTYETILENKYDYVIDCIDSLDNKCLLVSECVKRDIPIITTGGAAGKIDPTQIQIIDLAFSVNDPLLQRLRKKLRREYGFHKKAKQSLHARKKMGVMSVFSPEEQLYPTPEGGVCNTPDPETNLKLDCESGMGSSLMVTGTFGFMAASFVIKELSK